MFPLLKTTRLCQLSDFYTLAILIWKFEQSGFILTDKKRTRLAFDLLRNFSNGVDEARELQKKARGIQPGQELYREYLLTVIQSTDEIKQRQKREEILKGILESLYEKKDKNRIYSREQRRLIWNSEDEPKCAICGKAVTWEDYTADHIKPHSKGGKTDISNAALTTTTPVMVDHFGYFSRHFFVWDFWDFSLFCLCFMNQAITFWGFQVILGRTTSRSRRISGTVANTFFFFPLPLHSFQKGKGKH
jgi:hypothetical protein